MTRTASNLRFSVLQGFYWSAFCVLYTFLVPLYRQYGYSEITIGTLSMLTSLASVLIQPLWGMACDRSGRLRGILILNVTAAVPLAFGLLLGRDAPVRMGVIVFLLSATYLSMGPVIDSWTMKLVNQGHGIRYSLTRGIGSLVYAVTAAGFGRLLDAAGMGVIPFVFALQAALIVLIAIVTRSPAREAHHDIKSSPFAAISALMGNRRFVMFLISLILLYAGNGAIMVFMPVRMEALGGTNATLGIAMTVMALCEVPAMLLHHRFVRHIRNDTLLTASLFFFVVKGVATALAPSATVLILVQTLQFVSFGLYLPSAVQYINRLVDEKSLVTALLLFSSATYGLGMMIGGMAGGLLADAFGVQAMMLMLSGVTLTGVLLFAGSNIRHARAA